MSNRPELDALQGLSWDDLVARFGVGVENLDRRVFELADADLDTAFRADAGVGRWPARVLLGHLADAELALTSRMRKLFAEDAPVLHYWDEDAFIDAGIYGTPETGPRYPIGGFVAVVHTLRAWGVEWLRTLDEGARSRKGMHTLEGEMTLRGVVEYDVFHLEHHARFLSRKLDLLVPGTQAQPGIASPGVKAGAGAGGAGAGGGGGGGGSGGGGCNRPGCGCGTPKA